MKGDFNSDAENCTIWIYLFSKQKNSGWAMNVWKGYYIVSVGILILQWLCQQTIVRKTVRTVSQWVFYLWKYIFGSNRNAPPTKNAPKMLQSIKLPPLASPSPVFLPLAPQTNQSSNAPKSGQAENSHKVLTRQLPAKRSSSRPPTIVLFYMLFWTIFFDILGGELMIYWNHVQGVNSLDSSGQILSLLGGTFTLAQFVWAVSGLSLGSGS